MNIQYKKGVLELCVMALLKKRDRSEYLRFAGSVKKCWRLIAMTKQQFIEKLEAELKRAGVSDTPDIIQEYEQHFTFKLADGYSEEEISAKLGDPKIIAAQYDPSPVERKYCRKTIAIIAIGIADFFFGIFYILMAAWEFIMAALVIVFGATSVGLFATMRMSVFAFLPTMPYHCAIIFGIMFAALAVLAFVGTVYFFGFIRQILRSFSRFHKNTLAAISGKAALPPITVYPQFSAKTKRKLKELFLFALAVFAVCFIVGFVVCAIAAVNVQFWHAWGWFGYTG